MNASYSITYLRRGRKVRATGTIVAKGERGTVKVKPDRKDWGCVWLSADEVKAGNHRPPPIARKKPAARQARSSKPVPPPRYKQLVDEVRNLQAKHGPDEWPAVKMRLLSELADELESARTLFQS